MQFIVISLKTGFFQGSEALVGVYRDQGANSSKCLTLDVSALPSRAYDCSTNLRIVEEICLRGQDRMCFTLALFGVQEMLLMVAGGTAQCFILSCMTAARNNERRRHGLRKGNENFIRVLVGNDGSYMIMVLIPSRRN